MVRDHRRSAAIRPSTGRVSPTTFRDRRRQMKSTLVPGFTIKMATKPTKAGKITLVVTDKSSSHNFHLTGPGVNVKTSVPATGTKRFTVTLEKGTYKFVCD